jgi:hypothetical protein
MLRPLNVVEHHKRISDDLSWPKTTVRPAPAIAPAKFWDLAALETLMNRTILEQVETLQVTMMNMAVSMTAIIVSLLQASKLYHPLILKLAE